MKKLAAVFAVLVAALCVFSADYASNSIGQNLGGYKNGVYRLHTEDEVSFTLYENGTPVFLYINLENDGLLTRYTENLITGETEYEVYDGPYLTRKEDAFKKAVFEYDENGILSSATVLLDDKLAYVEFYLRTADGSLAAIRKLYPDGGASDTIFFSDALFENLVLLTPGGTVDFSDETLYCTYDGEYSVINLVRNDGITERRYLDETGKTLKKQIEDAFGNITEYIYVFNQDSEIVRISKTSAGKTVTDFLQNGSTVRTEVYENSELKSVTVFSETEKKTELYENGTLYVTANYDIATGKLTSVVYN